MKPGQVARRVIGPTVVLVLASISVALYYNITFFGKAVVALPSFPVTAGCLLYYLAAFNTTPPVAQVLLWMGSFTLSGWLWWWAVAKLVKTPWGGSSPLTKDAISRLRLLPIIYTLPLPWLLWVHAQSAAGPSLAALRASILVRDGLYWSSQGSELFLNALFAVLALGETLATLRVLRGGGENRWLRVLAAFFLAGTATMAALCVVAEIAFRLH
jgi:hypothetical protein